MIYAPNMLLIGASDRDAGKTVFACELVRRLKDETRLIGAKVTAVRERNGDCPRGGEGCGVCTSLEEDYCLTEETKRDGAKDTQRLLGSGAHRVFWLRVMHEELGAGARALLGTAAPDAPIVCESNSLRNAVEPGLFMMLRRSESNDMKASARNVMAYVDCEILSNGREFDFDWDRLAVRGGRWFFRYPATAIVLAGGKSERMGEDKCMLDIDGHPMIQHVVEQLRPHFDSVMVSGGDERKYGFLGTRIVADKWPGDGPLSGIASALDVSSTEQNLVVSCDTPEIDIRLVRRMLREARGYDAVAPVLGETHTEPLFAVYHKRAGKTFAAALADGKRDVRGAVDRCRTKYVQVEPGWNLPNLNTRGEYEKFVAKRAEQGSGKEKDAQ